MADDFRYFSESSYIRINFTTSFLSVLKVLIYRLHCHSWMRNTNKGLCVVFYCINLGLKCECLSLKVTCSLHSARTEESNYQSSSPSQLQIRIQIFHEMCMVSCRGRKSILNASVTGTKNMYIKMQVCSFSALMVRKLFFLVSGKEHQAVMGVLFCHLGKIMRKIIVDYRLTLYVIKILVSWLGVI